MGLESATFLSQLVSSNPPSTDQVKQGDDHIRLVKQVLQNTFPGLSFSVTFTAAGKALVEAADLPAQKTLLGIDQATETTAGTAKIATDAQMTTGTDDTVVGTAKKIATYVAAQVVALLAAAKTVAGAWTFTHSANTVQTLTDAATIAWDTTFGDVAGVTLTASGHTLGAPTGLITGGFYFIKLKQDATGSRTLLYNAIFDFGAAGAPTLTTAAGKSDTLSFFYDGTALRSQGIAKGFAS